MDLYVHWKLKLLQKMFMFMLFYRSGFLLLLLLSIIETESSRFITIINLQFNQRKTKLKMKYPLKNAQKIQCASNSCLFRNIPTPSLLPSPNFVGKFTSSQSFWHLEHQGGRKVSKYIAPANTKLNKSTLKRDIIQH